MGGAAGSTCGRSLGAGRRRRGRLTDGVLGWHRNRRVGLMGDEGGQPSQRSRSGESPVPPSTTLSRPRHSRTGLGVWLGLAAKMMWEENDPAGPSGMNGLPSSPPGSTQLLCGHTQRRSAYPIAPAAGSSLGSFGATQRRSAYPMEPAASQFAKGQLIGLTSWCHRATRKAECVRFRP